MNILIAGASGFIGHALVKSFKQKHNLSILGRDKTRLLRDYPSGVTCCTWDELSTLDANYFDAVINLCGYNIAASRWSAAIKQQLIASRVETNKTLIDWLIQQAAKPHFICANAVGIYGLQSDGDPNTFDEDTPIDRNHPPDFLSEIGVRWQESLQPAIDYGIPVTTTRFGVVLQKGQGMLKKMFLSFYLGLGSIVGSGKQALSWVHIDDVVEAMSFLLAHPKLTGPFNLTSPNPVSQEAFAHALAKSLHRPLFFKMPAVIVRILFGEMGECLLLKGQRVLPKRLLDAGYLFQYSELSAALQHEFS